MCKIEGVELGIKKLDFLSVKEKMLVYLTDGREVIIPISFFPDIKKLSLKQRDEWMILDDQFFTFEHLSTVYSVADILKLS